MSRKGQKSTKYEYFTFKLNMPLLQKEIPNARNYMMTDIYSRQKFHKESFLRTKYHVLQSIMFYK